MERCLYHPHRNTYERKRKIPRFRLFFRKVWVSIKFLFAKFGFTPPPPGKAGGGDAISWTKRFYGHLGVSDFLSVELRKRKRKKISGIFSFLRRCGLVLCPARAQHDHYESDYERKSGGIYSPFHCESENEINLQIFICNRFGADGISCHSPRESEHFWLARPFFHFFPFPPSPSFLNPLLAGTSKLLRFLEETQPSGVGCGEGFGGGHHTGEKKDLKNGPQKLVRSTSVSYRDGVSSFC